VNSANEYWAKAGSLLHVDAQGRDLPDGADVRYYFLSSIQHGVSEATPGICQQPRNPVRPSPTLRALLAGLDDWVTRGIEPPSSRVPRVDDGTLVAPWPQTLIGFPEIPGVAFNGRLHEGDLFDHGVALTPGVLNIVPPRRLGAPYPALVPKTDADGNDVAGIRQVEIAVPLATLTGWGLRRGSNDGCDAAGQQLAFAATRAERLAKGDPRLSIEERYPTAEDYVRKVRAAALELRQRRFLLDEDVERAIDSAKAVRFAYENH
jgi:hypothetical protein